MVERQDIDALLIGSLYGELSSTEEARLSAHLESHPADRTALANLSRAREVVRESRILQVQFEPPQSISALLMQEAARRAPKPREEQGWFQRFMRSFVAHPAMAAAAMLVLIIGVAGTVYMKKGDHFAKQTADEPSALAPAAQEPALATTPSDEGKAKLDDDRFGQAGSGSAAIASPSEQFKVQLDEDALKKQSNDKVVGNPDPADRSRNAETTATLTDGRTTNKKRETALALEDQKDQKGTGADLDANTSAAPKKNAPAKTVSKPVVKSPAPRLEVTTPSQAPKDFESSTVAGSSARKDTAGAGGATAPKAPATTTDARPGAAPPPPAIAEEKERAEKANDPNLAWAKEQHAKVIAAVKANNCQSAANLAVQIANRAPAYYASNVENDRAIKSCTQYIAQQREKEAERVQRAKATQRRAADEAPAPAKELTK